MLRYTQANSGIIDSHVDRAGAALADRSLDLMMGVLGTTLDVLAGFGNAWATVTFVAHRRPGGR